MKTITSMLHKVSFLTIQRLMLICLVMIGGCGAEEDEHEEALQVASKTVEYTESGVKFEVERAPQNLTDGIPERYTIRLTNETPNPIDTTDYAIKISAYKNTETQKMRKDIAFTYDYGKKKEQEVELGKKVSLKKEMNIGQLHSQKTVTIQLNTKNHAKYDLPEGAVEVILYPPGQQPIVIAKPWKCDKPAPYASGCVDPYFDKKNFRIHKKSVKGETIYTGLSVPIIIKNKGEKLQSLEGLSVYAKVLLVKSDGTAYLLRENNLYVKANIEKTSKTVLLPEGQSGDKSCFTAKITITPSRNKHMRDYEYFCILWYLEYGIDKNVGAGYTSATIKELVQSYKKENKLDDHLVIIKNTKGHNGDYLPEGFINKRRRKSTIFGSKSKKFY